MEGCGKGMNIVSDKYDKNEYFVPEVLVSARAMEAAVKVLRSHISVEEAEESGKVVLAVVEVDVHDIGKNLVKILLDSAGFEILDLGKDVSSSKLIETIREEKPQIVGLSTLMSPTLEIMEDTLKAFEDKGVRDKVKVMVGGAIVDEDFAGEVGADGYAEDASKAVGLAEKLMGGEEFEAQGSCKSCNTE
ncbi:MAG: Trimethylamine corrinoid protein MtbC1 [Candidatus Methanohalarchaeum thermophilum]|uniref:Trimethylamine corrinoid protein MtbC1 n=1 Tax=Methanohalarchaeum thermophilum TaxID=1903181 RepID=A0A1Q6DTV5_METT1|nr:MAG: Trimethylamine corrinoid protein MtbC1 [Candidatus Methanohalarchaeum thermophilum]